MKLRVNKKNRTVGDVKTKYAVEYDSRYQYFKIIRASYSYLGPGVPFDSLEEAKKHRDKENKRMGKHDILPEGLKCKVTYAEDEENNTIHTFEVGMNVIVIKYYGNNFYDVKNDLDNFQTLHRDQLEIVKS